MSDIALTHQQIREWQAALSKVFPDLNLKNDGKYGPQTQEAVKRFQDLAKRKGLYNGEVDGRLNNETQRLLNDLVAGARLASALTPRDRAQDHLHPTTSTNRPQSGAPATPTSDQRAAPSTDRKSFNLRSPEDVKSLQQELNRIKAQYGIKTMPYLEVDGKYGPKTREAVREFQKFLRVNGFASKNAEEFPIDGLWGPKTQAAYERFSTKDNPRAQANPSARVEAGFSIQDASSIVTSYSNGSLKFDLPLSPGDKFYAKDAAFYSFQLQKAIEMEQDQALRQRLEKTKAIFDQILQKYGNKPDQEFLVKVHQPSATRRIIPV